MVGRTRLNRLQTHFSKCIALSLIEVAFSELVDHIPIDCHIPLKQMRTQTVPTDWIKIISWITQGKKIEQIIKRAIVFSGQLDR